MGKANPWTIAGTTDSTLTKYPRASTHTPSTIEQCFGTNKTCPKDTLAVEWHVSGWFSI